MRPYRTLLQRCLGGSLHPSTALLAASVASRRGAQNKSSASHAVEIDGEEFHPTEYAQAGATSATRRRRQRTPAQLLNDISSPASLSKGDGAAGAAVGLNPVELLLQKHDVQTGGSGGSSSNNDDGRGGGGGGSGGRAKRTPLTPPTKAESTASERTRNGGADHKRSRKSSRASADKVEKVDIDALEEVDLNGTPASSPSTASVTDTAADSEDYQKSLQILTNPFRGLHGDVARSYRIDQLLEEAKPEDIMLARQERKSTAFSFLRFRAGENFYKGHWASLPEMQQQLNSSVSGSGSGGPTSKRGGAAAAATASSSFGNLGGSTAAPYVRGTPVPGLTLFNNDLGLQNPLVQCSYPLILAQRMLLFPDHLRHFHAICGREGVPCDFFADIDLPGESAAGAEKALLEVLNYLEVRLPGIGFTDPFFLVLTNAVPGKDKFSYHVHARSMTYVQERQLRAQHQQQDQLSGDEGASGKRKSGQKKTTKKGKKSSSANGRGAAEGHDDEDAGLDDYDDLSDMVNVVDGDSNGKKKLSGSTKLIAFEDYRTVKLIGDEVNQTLGRDVIDTNCYRPNGMLRCAFSCKLPSSQDHDFHNQQLQQDRHGAAAAAARKRLVPLVTASDSALQKRLSEMESVLRSMSDPEILEMTFCTRHMDHDAKVQRLVHEHAKNLVILDSHGPAGSEAQLRSAAVLQATLKHRWKLIRPRHILGAQADQAVEYDVYGNVVSPFLTEGAKWRRYKAVTAKLRKLPPRAAESYDVWVRVGLALHNFSNEDNCFEEWVLFSLKSPQKYSRDVCRKKWMQFERNPDALNWRRGYNYLNSTVWRQV